MGRADTMSSTPTSRPSAPPATSRWTSTSRLDRWLWPRTCRRGRAPWLPGLPHGPRGGTRGRQPTQSSRGSSFADVRRVKILGQPPEYEHDRRSRTRGRPDRPASRNHTLQPPTNTCHQSLPLDNRPLHTGDKRRAHSAAIGASFQANREARSRPPPAHERFGDGAATRGPRNRLTPAVG